MKKLLPVALLVSTGFIAACGSDGRTGPIRPVDLAECTIGTLTPGVTREFALGGATGCRTLDIWQSEGDTVRAASYSMRLGTNRLYAFRAEEKEARDTSSFDLTAALFGPGADTTEYGWLTASDDDWGGASGYAPVLYHIPQQAGDYAVRVAGFDAGDSARVVVLATDECPVGPTIADGATGTTTNATLTAEGCVANSDVLSLDAGVDSTRVTALRLTFPGAVTRRVRVISTAFHPTIFLGGPGPDIWGYGEANSDQIRRSAVTDTATVIFTTPRAGSYTMLVGAAEGIRTGAFKVLVDEGGAALNTVRATRTVAGTKRSR